MQLSQDAKQRRMQRFLMASLLFSALSLVGSVTTSILSSHDRAQKHAKWEIQKIQLRALESEIKQTGREIERLNTTHKWMAVESKRIDLKLKEIDARLEQIKREPLT